MPHVRLFGSNACPELRFIGGNATLHHIVAVTDLLESENILRMDWPGRSPGKTLIEHALDLLRKCLAAHDQAPHLQLMLKKNFT